MRLVYSDSDIKADSRDIMSNRFYELTKRFFDILLCLLLIPVLIPIMGLISIFILTNSPGPVLFKQRRIGKDGQPFTIFKFRTLYHQADSTRHQEFMRQYIVGKALKHGNGSYKPPIERQITSVGRLLRKTSLDELPQIINVLRGEMSLVGPRPNVEWEVQEYQNWHRERLSVKPGITGLAQVKGRSSISFDELVTFDIEYVQNQSIGLDFKIMFLTLLIVFKGRGAG